MIVDKELSAPEGSLRSLQILAPASPTVMIAITPDPRFVDKNGNIIDDVANAAGMNRSYKLATVSPGGYVPIHLLPHQTVWAVAEEGFAELSVIIEYREGT